MFLYFNLLIFRITFSVNISMVPQHSSAAPWGSLDPNLKSPVKISGLDRLTHALPREVIKPYEKCL